MAVVVLIASLLTPATAGALDGVNDWSCRPGAAHPNPVVLVHGTSDNKDTTWGTLGPLLSARGYCAYSLTYGALPNAPVVGEVVGGLMPIEYSAAQLGSFVDRVLTATGAAKVDIVGYSQGTMVPTYYAKKLDGAGKIARYVSLAPVWNGTNLDGLAYLYALLRALNLGSLTKLLTNCLACPELLTGSDFLAEMHEGGIFAPDIEYTNIVTRYDQLIVPYTSGLGSGPNVTNVVLQDACPSDHITHIGLPADPNAMGQVFNALDPAHAAPVPCVAVAGS
jgi:triacylglycerol lipase